MNLNEYKFVDTYLDLERTAERGTETIKPAAFYTVISAILAPYKDVKVRDFLDIDGTFSIVFEKYKQTPFEVLDLYQSIKDGISDVLFADGHLEGLVKLGSHEGFWIQFYV